MATFALDDLAIQRSHAVQSSSEVSRGVTPRLFQSFQPCHFTTGGVGCGELLLRLPVGLAKHVDVTSHPTQDVQVLMSLCDEAGMESAKGGDVALGCFNPALGMRAHDNQTACQSAARRPRLVSRSSVDSRQREAAQRSCATGQVFPEDDQVERRLHSFPLVGCSERLSCFVEQAWIEPKSLTNLPDPARSLRRARCGGSGGPCTSLMPACRPRCDAGLAPRAAMAGRRAVQVLQW
jgi:hypothetical protein